jgi:acyl-coenzyme A synthetase/AMP-(fatty) acid ligase
MNVLDLMARMVRANPDLPALTSRGRTLGLRALWRLVGAVAGQLAARGVAAGDTVLIGRVSIETHLLAVLALTRIGAVSCSLPAGMTADVRKMLARRTGARFGVDADGSIFAGIPGFTSIDEAWARARPEAGARLPALQRGLANSTWRLMLSSGTTGGAKLIAWTHGPRADVQLKMLEGFPAGPGERVMVCADLGMGLSLGQALITLQSGGTLVLPDNAQPTNWLQVIDKEKPTRIVTTTALAGTLAGHAKGRGGEGPLPGLMSLMVGGAPVPPALMADLQKHVCPNVVIIYGSTELGPSARSDPWSRAAFPESAGRLLPGIEAEAVDGNGQALAAGQVGTLRFRSRNGAMASGYLGDAHATAAAFRDGWFYPGDVGAVADGNLFLRGRADDRVNVGGVKIDPARVEKALDTVPGVKESALVQVTREGGRSALVAAIVAGEGFDSRAVGARVQQEAGKGVILVRVPSLPRNAGGKVMRKQLSEGLAKALASGRAKKAPQ